MNGSFVQIRIAVFCERALLQFSQFGVWIFSGNIKDSWYVGQGSGKCYLSFLTKTHCGLFAGRYR